MFLPIIPAILSISQEDQWWNLAKFIVKSLGSCSDGFGIASANGDNSPDAFVSPGFSFPPASTSNKAFLLPPCLDVEQGVPPSPLPRRRTRRSSFPPASTSNKASFPPASTSNKASFPPASTSNKASLPPASTSNKASFPPASTSNKASFPPASTSNKAFLSVDEQVPLSSRQISSQMLESGQISQILGVKADLTNEADLTNSSNHHQSWETGNSSSTEWLHKNRLIQTLCLLPRVVENGTTNIYVYENDRLKSHTINGTPQPMR
ncbi:unnamed protein product [Cyprideis torosa]|uniref:Uncharacterized protein n=1 Tax=Cyprideis torosa TaxID=163714 RepID=A0A7R8W7G7_9CRUS|nr:unnamed protein product [Cyprideis torosa]CAG0882147.1 unnamed protein product [Cyprideis torosa]